VSDEKELMTCFGINYAIQTYLVDDLNKAKDNTREVAERAIQHFTKEKSKYFIVSNGKIIR
jgi:hypothetical protein